MQPSAASSHCQLSAASSSHAPAAGCHLPTMQLSAASSSSQLPVASSELLRVWLIEPAKASQAGWADRASQAAGGWLLAVGMLIEPVSARGLG